MVALANDEHGLQTVEAEEAAPVTTPLTTITTPKPNEEQWMEPAQVDSMTYNRDSNGELWAVPAPVDSSVFSDTPELEPKEELWAEPAPVTSSMFLDTTDPEQWTESTRSTTPSTAVARATPFITPNQPPHNTTVPQDTLVMS